MIITHLSTVHRRSDNRIFLKECISLARAGFEVNLVIADGMGDAKTHGVRILDAGAKPEKRFRRMTSGVWRLFRKALETRANLFIIHDPELLTIARLLKRHGRVIYDMHENTPRQLESKEWLPVWARGPVSQVFSRLERLLLRDLHVIFAEKSYPEDYKWIKNSVVVMNMPRSESLLRILKNAKKRDVFTLCYIGEIAEKRGSMTILRALKILGKTGFPFLFEFIGHATPSHEEELRKTAFESGVLDKIRFRGYLPNEEGLKIVAECHVGLAVLGNIPNYTGSYPTKLFEYMVLGLPAIISDFSLYRKIAEENKFVFTVSPGDPAALAEAIRKVMELGGCQKALADNAALTAEKYSWDGEEIKLVDFVRDVLGQPPV